MKKEYFFNKNGDAIQPLNFKSSPVVKKEKLIGKNVEVLSVKNRNILAKGKIKSIDNQHLTIVDSDGIERVYEILQIIVKILPLIEQIVMFFKRIFSKNG